MKQLLRKYRDVWLYLVFGALTTLVNFLGYYLLSGPLALATVPATCIAWALSVAFAYGTNRRWVFCSQEKTPAGILREMGSFVACRLLSGLLDVGIMFVFVDLLHGPDLLVKLLSNVIVILVNYIASKLLIFRR